MKDFCPDWRGLSIDDLTLQEQDHAFYCGYHARERQKASGRPHLIQFFGSDFFYLDDYFPHLSMKFEFVQGEGWWLELADNRTGEAFRIKNESDWKSLKPYLARDIRFRLNKGECVRARWMKKYVQFSSARQSVHVVFVERPLCNQPREVREGAKLLDEVPADRRVCPSCEAALRHRSQTWGLRSLGQDDKT